MGGEGWDGREGKGGGEGEEGGKGRGCGGARKVVCPWACAGSRRACGSRLYILDQIGRIDITWTERRRLCGHLTARENVLHLPLITLSRKFAGKNTCLLNLRRQSFVGGGRRQNVVGVARLDGQLRPFIHHQMVGMVIITEKHHT